MRPERVVKFSTMPRSVSSCSYQKGLELERCVVVAQLYAGVVVYPEPFDKYIEVMKTDPDQSPESLAHTQAVMERNASHRDRLTCAVFGYDDELGKGVQRVILKTLPLPRAARSAGIARWNDAKQALGPALPGLDAVFRNEMDTSQQSACLENLKQHGLDLHSYGLGHLNSADGANSVAGGQTQTQTAPADDATPISNFDLGVD